MGSRPITTTPRSSLSTTTTLKCPKMPNIQPYLTEMQEKSVDLCDRTKYFYVDHVDRFSDFAAYSVKLKERILYSQKAYNASFNLTYAVIRNATGVAGAEFREAFGRNGFLDWPLSCYNKLIMMLKIEHIKLVGRFEATIGQLNGFFGYFHKK